MADLLLYGSGWTQRWTIGASNEAEVRAKIMAAGSGTSGVMTVMDPNTDAPVTLVVNWSLVAVALVLDDHPEPVGVGLAGRYA